MQHEPRGFLSYSDCAVKLVGANAVLGVCDQPEGSQPLAQSNGAIFQHSSDLHGKLLLCGAMAAFPNSPRGNIGNVLRLAARTFDAMRPTKRHEKIVRTLFVSEINDGL